MQSVIAFAGTLIIFLNIILQRSNTEGRGETDVRNVVINPTILACTWIMGGGMMFLNGMNDNYVWISFSVTMMKSGQPLLNALLYQKRIITVWMKVDEEYEEGIVRVDKKRI